MPQNSITPTDKSKSVNLGGMMAHVQAVFQRFYSTVFLPLIPSQASSSNKLADKAFVNSSISTATATYRGGYNLVSDLSLTVSATEVQIAAALATTVSTADNNDYCYVQVPTADATPTEIDHVDRYKYNGTAWAKEYTLNNSGYTAAQWASINSGITNGLVSKLSALPSMSELNTLLGEKQDAISDLSEFGNGIGTCVTAAATAAKEVILQDYELVKNGFVAVTFSYDVPANATLDINSKGAKPIYQNGAALAADVIKAGDIVTLCYNGTQFDITNIEHSAGTYDKTEINEMFEDVVRAGFVPRFNSTTGIMELDSVGGATIAPNSTTGIIEMTF